MLRPWKFCKDCKFYRELTVHSKSKEAAGTALVYRDCMWPLDVVTGKPKATDAYTMRQAGGECGPDGNRYEAK